MFQNICSEYSKGVLPKYIPCEKSFFRKLKLFSNLQREFFKNISYTFQGLKIRSSKDIWPASLKIKKSYQACIDHSVLVSYFPIRVSYIFWQQQIGMYEFAITLSKLRLRWIISNLTLSKNKTQAEESLILLKYFKIKNLKNK